MSRDSSNDACAGMSCTSGTTRPEESFVTMSGNTPNGVQISSVYTPPEFRGNGYASNAVAAASRGALAAGAAFCVLFADPEPAQPARIYRSIGYRPIREHLVIVFSR